MFRKRNARRSVSSFERLESRRVLASGNLIHTHNESQLAVVDSLTGELETIADMSGFAEGDRLMSDIAFSPDGRLYGITANRLYEIHPVTAALTNLGLHEVPNANAMTFEDDGTLFLMGRNDATVFDIVFNESEIEQTRTAFELSGLDGGEGANGDIAIVGPDLLVATSDNRLVWYRRDVNPDRPRVVRELDLSDLDISDVFGLATTDNNEVVATTDEGVIQIDLASAIPTGVTVEVSNEAFGELRGAAYYAEAGGPVPIGTVAGTEWQDLNGDGIQQTNEPVLADWTVYLDLDLDGVLDDDEPSRQTNEDGRFHFFGLEPGMYTVDQIIPNAADWEQTSPRSAHRNLAGVYSFNTPRAENELFHDFGLPNMSASFVNLAGAGLASLVDGSSYLELPVALGDQPFSIIVDATYTGSLASDKYFVSQQASDAPDDRDFRLLTPANSGVVVGQFCDGTGSCTDVESGGFSQRDAFGITWDGDRVGAFADDALVIDDVTGTRPDVDGGGVRFGNPVGAVSPSAMQGSLHEIRIYNNDLSESELANAFTAAPTPNAYTVYVDDTRGVDDTDFGNREPEVVVLEPEIEIRRGTTDGPIVNNNATISLGRAASSDESPNVQLFIHNLGNTTLDLTTTNVTDGFEITGDLTSNVAAGGSTSLFVTLIDRTPGEKTGTLTIDNNDADENPFVITLTTELVELDLRPRQVLINTTAGNVLRVDRTTGQLESLMSGLPAMTDIAHHPTENRLYGIDESRIFELDIVGNRAIPLFNHGVRQARALAFDALGTLMAAGTDIYSIDLVGQTSTQIADGPAELAGDLGVVGTTVILSTEGGNLYEVRDGQTVLIGDSGNITLTGLAAVDADSLFGFSANQTFDVDILDASLNPQFSRFVFSIAGATFQPEIRAHNERNPLDVNDDGNVNPFDVILVINEINSPQFTDPETTRLIAQPFGDTKYPDVNNDGFVSAIDALLIINFLNEQAQAVAARSAIVQEPDDRLGTLPAADPLDASLVDEAMIAIDAEDALNDQNRRARSTIS